MDDMEKNEETNEETKGLDIFLPINNGDIDKFFDCVCDDKPYIEAISLFGGKLKVHFRTRTMVDVDEMATFMKEKDLKSMTMDDYYSWQSRCELATSLYGTEKKGRDIDFFDPKNTGLKKRIEYLSTMPGHKFLLYSSALFAFNNKVMRLQQEATKQNF